MFQRYCVSIFLWKILYVDYETKYTAQKQKDLADQQTCKISADSGGGDEKKDTGDPYAEAEKVEQKRTGGLSQPVDHAEKYSVRIQKRTDPCECQNKISGKRTFEQKDSNPFPGY